jgi:hypothetical protein
MMNVVYPKNDMIFRNTFFIISFGIAIVLFVYAIYKYKEKSLKNLIVLISLFLV